jgi:soluble lytic murein transglycosylase-like protein|tara:strand:- start:486 stop:1004 length:519 start_codon:yes stop_codon:yes gene_type:complete
MAYVEIIEPDIPIQTKTETVVRMVNVPFAPSDYELQAEEIKSSLNKSKLKHILIYIEALCWEYGVDYEMVKAVIQTESDWNHKAVSTSGAIGLMQVLPSTAMSEFKTPEKDLYDPYVNVTVGIKYLSKLNKHFDDMESTLTAYSHGPTVTKKYSNNYISNNFYVKRVQKNLK